MDTNMTAPTYRTFEGFGYLEHEGQFYKGCKRCGGSGFYSHNGEHDRCYECDADPIYRLGDRFADEAAAQKWCHERAVRRAQRLRKQEKERLAKVAVMEAKQEQVKAADPEVFEFLMGLETRDALHAYETYEEYYAAEAAGTLPVMEKDSFLVAMSQNLKHVSEYQRPFTANMLAAVRRTMERRQAKQAFASEHPAPSGRVEVTGKITGIKVVEGDYGTAFKVTVESDEGFRVYVSLAKALADQAHDAWIAQVQENGHSIYDFAPHSWFTGTNGSDVYTGVKGRRLAFTATLEQSKDDEGFAFGSRPTKATWI